MTTQSNKLLPKQTFNLRYAFARAVFPFLLTLGCGLVTPQSASAQWCHDGLGTPCGDLLQRICVVDAWWNLSNCPSECKSPYSLRSAVCRAACPTREIAG